jgi:hypothetical protein
MTTAKVVATYKSLARVERDFRSLKAIDVDLRPIHHHTSSRVRAHVFICMLAAYLVWHLRQAWAPLTFTDEHRPDPVAPDAPRQPTSKQRPRPPPTTYQHTVSPGCSHTSPRCPATTYASPATTSPASTCSPCPPHAEPSTSWAPRSPSP